jgi:hypothetical protein
VTNTDLQSASDARGIGADILKIEHSTQLSKTYVMVFYLGHKIHLEVPMDSSVEEALDVLQLKIDKEYPGES